MERDRRSASHRVGKSPPDASAVPEPDRNALKFSGRRCPRGATWRRPRATMKTVERDCRGTPIWENLRARQWDRISYEKYAERIFSPFSGLNGRPGLIRRDGISPSAARIVDLLRRTITASSHPGAGATFLLTLTWRRALGTQAGGRADEQHTGGHPVCRGRPGRSPARRDGASRQWRRPRVGIL